MKRFVTGWAIIVVLVSAANGTSWAACLEGETEGEIAGRLVFIPENIELDSTGYFVRKTGDEGWVVYPVGPFFGTPGMAGPTHGPEIDAKLGSFVGRDVRMKGCLGVDDMVGAPAISEISSVDVQ